MNNALSLTSSLSAMMALLLPVGLILIAGSGLAGRRPARSAMAGLGALALSAAGFWACGFAFHLGGIGLVADASGLEGLVWEWASPLNLDWGVLGLRGFFLAGEAGTPLALALYLAYLPSLAVAVVLPLLSLRERLPGWMAALGGLLLAGLVYPTAGNWFSGGGWLMHVGQTLGLGHGYIDAGGASSAALVGGVAALLGILFFGRRLPPLPAGELPGPPPVHLPVMAALGAALAVVGGAGLAAANPLLLQNDTLPLSRAMVSVVLAAAGGALLPALYTWFAAGEADSLLTARGAAAGVLAAAAGAAFMPAWAALALGAVAGLLVPLLTFAVSLAHVDDPTGAVALALAGGTLGVLAPGLLSDGRYGAGWNGIGADTYLGVAGQGVSGLLPGPGLAVDWAGQFNAQLLGLAAIAALTTVLVGLLFLVFKIVLAWWRYIPAEE